MPRPEHKLVVATLDKASRLKSGLAVGLALVALVVAEPVPAAFAQSEPTGDEQLKGLVKELNAELQRGEEQRLIDPWFLRDLRQMLSRYENPWDTLIFEDKFSSRGNQPGAPWQVVAGEVLVDWRYGMRSVVAPVALRDKQPQAAQENPLAQIFGSILKRATNKAQEQEEPSQAPRTEISPAAAIAPMTITNAFAIRVELTSRPVDDVDSPRFELGPYQGQGAAAGYRLVLKPGSTPSLELTSVSSRGTVATIELYQEPLALADGQVHVIEWTRDKSGQMVIRVDAAEVMNVADRRFAGNFDGFSVANQGGDIALRSIRIDGAS